ncbi:Belongs to the ubiquitin-conjugating enzyme [Dionaea muscipula]
MESPQAATESTPHGSEEHMMGAGISIGGGSSVAIMDVEDIKIPPPLIFSTKKKPSQQEVTPLASLPIEDAAAADADHPIKTTTQKSGSLSIFVEEQDTDMDLDEWYYDEDNILQSDDEVDILQTHFDSLDIPPGAEASIPWWPFPAGSKQQVASANNSWYSSLQSLDKESIGLPVAPASLHGQQLAPSNPFHVQPGAAVIGHGNFALEITSNSSTPSTSQPSSAEFDEASTMSEMTGYPIQLINIFGHKPKSSKSDNPSITYDKTSREVLLPVDCVYEMKGDTIGGDILKKLDAFKRFDVVEDHSDHYYSNKAKGSMKPSKRLAKKIQEEWKILEKDLPDTIFVRVYESRMDLLRAVIMGAEGTPYHDGIFFFDVYFPSEYPNSPPLVYYRSGGLNLNPNLYSCGKVCLSLLNTWKGSPNEEWQPGYSTILQVLVSIQGLVLNSNPYFNEPGYAFSEGTADGKLKSEQYSEHIFLLSLKTMLYTMKRPPKHFENLVYGHFFKRAHTILAACKAYMDGAQVGSLGTIVEGDTPPKAKNKNIKRQSSQALRMSLPRYVNPLLEAFAMIGVEGCDKYLQLDTGTTSSSIPAT